tara:strand:+ start:878 stop:1420 length:543 start_codon:yes stop_codon:yes gene_type:complete
MAKELTKDEIFVRKELENIYPQLEINCRKVCGEGYWRWGNDLLSVAITFFLEKPIEAQLKTVANNKLENFITWIMNMQLKSSSSYFYSRYRKPRIMMREMYEGDLDYMYGTESVPEDALICIREELNNIPVEYKEAILAMVYDKETEGNLIKKFNLGRIGLRKELDKHLTYIQTKCQHCI